MRASEIELLKSIEKRETKPLLRDLIPEASKAKAAANSEAPKSESKPKGDANKQEAKPVASKATVAKTQAPKIVAKPEASKVLNKPEAPKVVAKPTEAPKAIETNPEALKNEAKPEAPRSESKMSGKASAKEQFAGGRTAEELKSDIQNDMLEFKKIKAMIDSNPELRPTYEPELKKKLTELKIKMEQLTKLQMVSKLRENEKSVQPSSPRMADGPKRVSSHQIPNTEN